MMNILLESEYQRAMLETELEWSVRYSTSRARSTEMERGVAPSVLGTAHLSARRRGASYD